MTVPQHHHPPVSNPGEPAICTIISRNYLCYARALVRSFRNQHPTAEAWVLVVDDPEPHFDPAAEDFHVVRIADLKLPNPASWLFRYTPFELCNSVKPQLIRHVLRDLGRPAVIYLDSDIGIFNPIDAFWKLTLQTGLVLTPHCLSDYPADGCWPDRSVLQTAGIFNAGILGVASGWAEGFLDWWANALEFDCEVDLPAGRYVDQRYLDLVPTWFPDAKICLDPGMNVAHFNLHERTVELVQNRWSIGGIPLVAFHFTLVDWERQTFWPPVNRPLVSHQPRLRTLIQQHSELLHASGWTVTRQWPGGYDCFRNGLKISPATRRAFRLETKAQGYQGDPFVDPTWMTFERSTRRRAALQRTLSIFPRFWNRLSRLLAQFRRTEARPTH